MLVSFDVTTHPLISAAAAAVQKSSVQAFQAHNVMAETLLGLHGALLSGDAADTAQIAVAMQLNFQIAQGMDPYIQTLTGSSSVNRGRSGFRGNQQQPPLVHGQAQRLADTLLRTVTETITSVRSRD